MIILEAQGGLANRMRVIASGLWLKDKLKTELSVIWNENYELNCPYDQLFRKSDMFTIQAKPKKYNYVKTSNQQSAISKISAGISNKFIGIDYCLQETDITYLVCTGKLDIYEATKNHKTIYLQTCQEFGDNLPYFKYFEPVKALNEKINDITNNFDPHTIGVQIRRGDHDNSIKHSPTELFIDKMQDEINAQVNANFFLCTDDTEVEKAIIDKFGDKVVTHKKELSRHTVQGMQDAMVDLYCLSKTKKILGSYWSSFSEVAARLNNIELEVVKSGEHILS